jgi:hypothetical protein
MSSTPDLYSFQARPPTIDCASHPYTAGPVDSRRPKVAILGTRFDAFDVEREVLGEI